MPKSSCHEPDEAFESLPEILVRRGLSPNERWSLTFLEGDGKADRLDAAALAARVAGLARYIAAVTAPRERILLLYPPGTEFLIGFMACLTANRPAVPVNPPRRNRLIERVDGIVADAGARIALTTSAMLADQGWWREGDLPLARLAWHESDRIAPEPPGTLPEPIAEEDVAFLQYTSGSTATPKGVVVTHGNLIADMARMAEAWDLQPDGVMVSWLPAFHDLGLIFGLLQPLYSGCATVAMAPARFLQTPFRWLEAISQYRGTHTAAPNFAYDLCVRRVTETQAATLDLSCLRMAMNAAEPVDPQVMAQFAASFGPRGFGATVTCPAFGLAESTLAITANPVGEAPVLLTVAAATLETQQRVAPLADGAPGGRVLAGSGRPLRDVGIAIVDPARGARCADNEVGEVWASGPTIAVGYWNNPAATAENFGVSLPGDGGRYLRTGDLGFLHEGELFITGRLKDLIILNGVNFYPQDLERAAFRSHAALRPECSAAFALAASVGQRERLVIVQEVERVHRRDAPKPMIDAVRDAVWRAFDVAPDVIALIEPGAILRTSSGKIRRGATRAAWEEGSLPVLASWERPTVAALGAGSSHASETLRDWLLGWLADQIAVAAARIDPDESFAAYGLDSVAATQLAAVISERIGRGVPQTVAWDHPTPNRLLAYLAGDQPQTPTPHPGPHHPAPTGNDFEEILGMLERDASMSPR